MNLLRQVEVSVASGKTKALTCKVAAIAEQTHYRWRREYGGLQVNRARRLKELEREITKVNLAAGAHVSTTRTPLFRLRIPC